MTLTDYMTFVNDTSIPYYFDFGGHVIKIQLLLVVTVPELVIT